MKYSLSERFSWEWSSGPFIPLFNDLLLDNGFTFRSLCRYIKSITMHNSCCPLTEVISYGVRKCIVNFVLAANLKCASVGQCRNSRRATDQVDDESAVSISLDREGKKILQLTLILLTWRKWWTPNNATKWQMGFNSAFKRLSVCVPKQNVLGEPDKPCTSLKKCYNLLCRIR